MRAFFWVLAAGALASAVMAASLSRAADDADPVGVGETSR